MCSLHFAIHILLHYSHVLLNVPHITGTHLSVFLGDVLSYCYRI
uniref:Uncharacterized protein n=1 Tax=Anguilla anguilla TaxID=7936 RepID=A0A0E9SUN8_ANGAN